MSLDRKDRVRLYVCSAAVKAENNSKIGVKKRMATGQSERFKGTTEQEIAFVVKLDNVQSRRRSQFMLFSATPGKLSTISMSPGNDVHTNQTFLPLRSRYQSIPNYTYVSPHLLMVSCRSFSINVRPSPQNATDLQQQETYALSGLSRSSTSDKLPNTARAYIHVYNRSIRKDSRRLPPLNVLDRMFNSTVTPRTV
jgi:hypothetical protein